LHAYCFKSLLHGQGWQPLAHVAQELVSVLRVKVITVWTADLVVAIVLVPLAGAFRIQKFTVPFDIAPLDFLSTPHGWSFRLWLRNVVSANKRETCLT
jgi:hypothetical protein